MPHARASFGISTGGLPTTQMVRRCQFAPAVDFQGNPLSASQDPLLYSKQGLICFSVFGIRKSIRTHSR
jgi:hypothetical protein